MNKSNPVPFEPVMTQDITKLGNKFIFLCQVEATKLPEDVTNLNITHYTFALPDELKKLRTDQGLVGLRSQLSRMYDQLQLQIEGKV